jgi:hypothetical protein
MADSELIRTLDYILNRCDEKSIEAVAAALVRRRRELTLFGGASSLPDPESMAKQFASQINIEGAIEGLQKSVRDYAVRIIRQEAPDLTEAQIEELTRAWIPETGFRKKGKPGENGFPQNEINRNGIPQNLLASMIDQFVSFSLGRMEAEEDRALRKEMGSWPDKYWRSFPQVIRLLVTDFLKGEMGEEDFNTQISRTLSMQ